MICRYVHGFRSSRFLWILAPQALSLAVSVMGRGAVADDGQAAAPDREARTVEMRQIAESLSVVRVEGADKGPVSLRREPLLRWNDPTRQFSDASLWAWGGPGRPQALLALELYAHSEQRDDNVSSWAFEFISLTPDPLDVRGGEGAEAKAADKFREVINGNVHWSPTRTKADTRAIPDAPTPAATPALRLVQMRQLVKRFGAKEHPGRMVILRLMPHPIDRYADAENGLVDGAAFVFATGTNPEAILFVEARGSSPDKAAWHYAVARVTAAPYEVSLDGRDVWTEPYADGQRTPSEAYYTNRLPRRRQ